MLTTSSLRTATMVQVRSIAENLIKEGFPTEKICVEDTSSRFQGLLSRNTIKEIGIKKLVDEL